MQCPAEIAEIVCDILRMGILRLRNVGSQDGGLCFLEADHLHNLPTLLMGFSQEQLDYYWHVERVAFLEKRSAEQTQAFEPLWKSLRKYVISPKNQAVAS
jgi:hypothetical protein